MPGKTNSVGWFSVGTDQPDVTAKFYAELFGWGVLDGDKPFRVVTTPAGTISGALFATGGDVPNFATFVVVVDDVEATLRKVEEQGGKVLMPPKHLGGGHEYAQISDPQGNNVGIINMASEL